MLVKVLCDIMQTAFELLFHNKGCDMNIKEAVAEMGPSLALHVFLTAERLHKVTHAEWIEVARTFLDLPLARETYDTERPQDLSEVAQTVAKQLCERSSTFSQRAATLELLLETRSLSDLKVAAELPGLFFKIEYQVGSVSDCAACCDLARRAYKLTTLRIDQLDAICRKMRIEALKRASTFDDYAKIATWTKYRDPEWYECLTRMEELAGDSATMWAAVYKECARLHSNSDARRERAFDRLVKLSAL